MGEMLEYYEERAAEYDAVYSGGGAASVPDAETYRRETEALFSVVKGFGRGHLLDVACGTAFWLPAYAPNCERMTLVDQSPGMLAEARGRAEEAGVAGACRLVRQDVLEGPLPTGPFDCALMGFFLSHLTLGQEGAFLARLTDEMAPSSPVLILDSAWSAVRARHRSRAGEQRRTLEDGRTFTIYKRYFDRGDVEQLCRRNGLALESCDVGDVMAWALARSA